jgi:hypothetical protein
MEKLMNKEDLLINKLQLDKELVEQATKFYEVSEECAIAASLRDAAYDAVKTTDAQLYFDIRKELEENGTKATEAMVANLVLKHPDHQVAVTDHLTKKLKADELSAMKESFSQRSFMLRDLVSLFIAGYYTDSAITNTTSNSSKSEVDLVVRRDVLNEKRSKSVQNRIKATKEVEE